MRAVKNIDYRSNNPRLEAEAYKLTYKFSGIYFPQYHPKARYSADDMAGDIFMELLRVRRSGNTLLETLREDLPKGQKEAYIKRFVLCRIIDSMHKDNKTEIISIDEYSGNEGDNWTDRGEAENTSSTINLDELLVDDVFEMFEDSEITSEMLANSLLKRQTSSLAKIRKIFDTLTSENALSDESVELFSKAFDLLKAARTKSIKESVVTEGKKSIAQVLGQTLMNGPITKKAARALLQANGFSPVTLNTFLYNHSNKFNYNKETCLISLA